MSIEANTYEEICVRNNGVKTAEFLERLKEYLNKTWGIVSLRLVIDGQSFSADDVETISDDVSLASAIDNLAIAKEVNLALRSCNAGGASWRLEQPFMVFLIENPELNDAISYRSIDYYDCDSCVDAYIYDKKGMHRVDYENGVEAVSDIQRWYSYTPAISIVDEGKALSVENYEALIEKLRKLCINGFEWEEENFEDRCEDDWEESGEIVINGSISFSSKNITYIAQICNDIANIVASNETVEFEFSVAAVSDGEDDYNFAVLSLEFDGESLNVSSVSF